MISKRVQRVFFLSFFFMILIAGATGWCFISGFKGMFLAPVHSMDEAYVNLVEGDVYEGTISCISSEVGELKHLVKIIPIGTEHFYLMFSEDGTKAIPIRVPKKWDKQFTNDSVMEVSLQERGVVREMYYKVKYNLISSVASELATQGVSVEENLYLDLNANKICVLQIITGIFSILCCIYFGLAIKRGEINGEKTIVRRCMNGLLIVTLVMAIYVLSMTRG